MNTAMGICFSFSWNTIYVCPFRIFKSVGQRNINDLKIKTKKARVLLVAVARVIRAAHVFA